MKYTYENFRFEFEEDLDMVNIVFELHFTEPKELIVPKFITFRYIYKYIAKKNAALATYIDKLRSGIPGYGPNEIKLINMLNNDHIDLFDWTQKWYEEGGWAKAEFEQWEKIVKRSPEEQQKLEETVAMLDKRYDNMAKSIKRSRECCNELEKAVTTVILKFYPEIMESNSDIIHEFGYLFVSEIQDIENKAQQLRQKAMDANENLKKICKKTIYGKRTY